MNNLSRFGLSIADLDSVIDLGLSSGGSWCDLYLEDTYYFDLLLRDSSVSAGGSHIDCGCGIRVLDGEKTGYAYCESTELPELLKTARAAGAIGGAPRVSVRKKETRKLSADEVYLQERDWLSSRPSDFVPFLESIEKEIRCRDSRVQKIEAMLSFSVSEVAMYNSDRELACESRPLGSVSVTATFRQGDKIDSGTSSRSFRCGAEMLGLGLVSDLAGKLLDNLDARFEARRPKGGKMSVVMAAGASGILLHEAMGHAFEADFNRKGQSIFADKMGARVCRKGINIVDDGTIHGNRGACAFDDEGVPGQKTYMVEDGVLTSYLHDRISAAHYGVAPTGNGRRESFRYHPIPRMRTTYMESGPDGTVEDLIASLKKGVYVDQFSNGQVKIGEGDFTFFVKSGWLIENGRLTMPVKDINIIGNGPQALADMVAVAGDLEIDDSTWTCGKEQSVAVSCGIPSVLVNNLTVGGAAE